MARNNGFRYFRPGIRTDRDWKLAYGLECIRIWKDATDEQKSTGTVIDSYYPTEEEFREARKSLVRRSIYRRDRKRVSPVEKDRQLVSEEKE